MEDRDAAGGEVAGNASVCVCGGGGGGGGGEEGKKRAVVEDHILASK